MGASEKLQREVAAPGDLCRDGSADRLAKSYGSPPAKRRLLEPELVWQPSSHYAGPPEWVSDRRYRHGGRMMMDIEGEIAALAELDATRLRQQWQQLTDNRAPRVSPRLLRLAVAYQIQTKALGGLSPSARRKLAQAAGGKTVTQQAGSGSRLVREWQGVAHVVTIDEGGIIRWNDREWKSLSAVARAITGGHWSGPAFFGLRKATGA